MFVSVAVCATLLLGISARSTGYNNYGYGGQRAPPAVAANGSGRQNGRGGVDSPRDMDQTKGILIQR